jgi:hypothetical protein
MHFHVVERIKEAVCSCLKKNLRINLKVLLSYFRVSSRNRSAAITTGTFITQTLFSQDRAMQMLTLCSTGNSQKAVTYDALWNDSSYSQYR